MAASASARMQSLYSALNVRRLALATTSGSGRTGAGGSEATVLPAAALRSASLRSASLGGAAAGKTGGGAGAAEHIPLFFTWIPILALLSNYYQEICLIHVGTEGIPTALVSSELFATLGVTAARGRLFTPAGLVPGQDCVVILSDSFWQRRFDGNPGVLGKHATIDGSSYCRQSRVVPVMDQNRRIDLRSVLLARNGTVEGHCGRQMSSTICFDLFLFCSAFVQSRVSGRR